MRIALGIEYLGTPYFGWQSQAHGNTVQDVLERALAQVACEPIRTICAGRTDTGVHALAQVVHFDTGAIRPVSAWVRGGNTHLPPSISVRWAAAVDEEFNARFSAQGRRYRYLLLNRTVRPALLNGLVGWHHSPLDLSAMQFAAEYLHGEHDFSAFRSSECQAKSPIRNMQSIAISRQNDVIVIDLSANAFLHHMVRNIVGALVYIGDGRRQPAWMEEILMGRDRSKAAPTFDAAGLYLAGIEYDARWRLPHDDRIIAPSSLFPGIV